MTPSSANHRRAMLRMFKAVTGNQQALIQPPMIAGEREAVPFQRSRVNNYFR